ncbi:MAG: recombinase family protein [Lachnospiraceae bacterium]|nr:recombinase family protein [Lachnospiraceae bacterium]
MENKKERCYTYSRVSTAMQVDGYSLDAQKDRITKYAEFQGMEIVHEYCDV